MSSLERDAFWSSLVKRSAKIGSRRTNVILRMKWRERSALHVIWSVRIGLCTISDIIQPSLISHARVTMVSLPNLASLWQAVNC